MACRKHFFEKLPGNGGTTTTAALHLNVGQLLFGLDMTEYDTDYQGKRGGGRLYSLPATGERGTNFTAVPIYLLRWLIVDTHLQVQS